MMGASPTTFFPPSLKMGGTVGVVSPASWAEASLIAAMKEKLQEAGFRVEIHPQNYMKDGMMAGSAAARAEAISDMFADTTIDAVLCARGGTGCIDLLDCLDYKLIKSCPKTFVGFSDITLLLQVLSKQCGFVTFHGPMARHLSGDRESASWRDFLNVVGHGTDKQIRLFYDKPMVVRAGKADGVLVGGNLTLLQHLLGTPFEFSTKNALLFIEDTGEKLYRVVHVLRHLFLAGKLKEVRAVIVGEMVDIRDDGVVPFGRTLREAFLEILPNDVPICFDFPCGHGDYLTTLPVGAYAHVQMDARGVGLTFMR